MMTLLVSEPKVHVLNVFPEIALSLQVDESRHHVRICTVRAAFRFSPLLVDLLCPELNRQECMDIVGVVLL